MPALPPEYNCACQAADQDILNHSQGLLQFLHFSFDLRASHEKIFNHSLKSGSWVKNVLVSYCKAERYIKNLYATKIAKTDKAGVPAMYIINLPMKLEICKKSFTWSLCFGSF